MPEINLSVKIKGGKKTPTSVEVMSRSINKKIIQFQNGAIISDGNFESLINAAIVKIIIDRWNPPAEG